MPAKSVLSDEARRRFREILNDVEHSGNHYEIRRYQTPSAMVVPVEWYEQAMAVLSDASAVTLKTSGMNQAGMLRRLVREHGSVGMPFPNNTQATWEVVDRATGQPVNRHAIPSVGVSVVGDPDE